MSLVLRPRSRRIAYLAGLWLLSVVAYAFAYWLLWFVQPDAFIVNKEFNLTPIQDLHTKLWGNDSTSAWSPIPSIIAPGAIELDSLMGTVAELDRTAAEAEKSMAPLRSEQAQIEAELKQALQRHSELIWANVERYKSSAGAEERSESQKQADLVAALKKRFGPDPPSHQAIVLAEARVSLAHARYREAVKSAEVGDFVLKNLGTFADSVSSSEIRRLEELLKDKTQRQTALSARLSDVRKRAQDSLQSWYATRQPRLLWIDFIYFSVGVSTTTTFGDIIPNSRTARIFVMTQLVVSVLLVGYLVSLIGPTEDRSAT